MAIPALGPMQSQINIVGGPDKFVGESRSAAGAEDRAGLAKRSVNRLIPPACVTELDDIAPSRVELAENRSEPRLRIPMTWGKLEEKAAHPLSQEIGDHAKIRHKSFRALEPLDMSDEFADFDGVNEVLL